MKKILLFTLLGFSGGLIAQVLQTENFNGLTVGNVGTDITGATPGQGAWLTFSSNGADPTTSTNSNNTNFQIVANGNNISNGVLFEGPNGDNGSRFMWKDGLPAAWTSRTSGNDIIEVELSLNPGTRGTSRNLFGVRIFNSDGSRTLAGFQVNAATGELFLIAYSTPSGNPVGNYSYPLAAAPGVQLPENTWSRIGISFNKTTGQVLINSDVISGGPLALTGSSAGVDPSEVDFLVISGHSTTNPNTTSASMIFDGFEVRATNTDTLLDVNSFTNLNNTISIYPNPANDVLNITSELATIQTVSVVDLNGRTVKQLEVNNTNSQINVSDLNAGVYMLNIQSEEGKTVKKFIKN